MLTSGGRYDVTYDSVGTSKDTDVNGSPKFAHWLLRSSRAYAACIGRIQSPTSSQSSREAMSSQAKANCFVMLDFLSEVPVDMRALHDRTGDRDAVDNARARLLAKRPTSVEVWALRRAGHIYTTVDDDAPTTVLRATADTWLDQAMAIHTLPPSPRRSRIRELRMNANANVIGFALSGLSACSTGQTASDFALLARATLGVRPSA